MEVTHLVVEIPSMVEVVDLAVLTVSTARLASVLQVSTERLRERDLAKRFGSLQSARSLASDGREQDKATHSLEHIVKRFQRREHGVNVVVAVEQSRSLLETFVPELVPEDGDADKLLTDE